MVGACGTCGGEERCTCSGSLKERDLWKKPRRCWEGNIEMEIVHGDVDRSDLAQDREKWRAIVNAMIKPLDSIKCGGFLD